MYKGTVKFRAKIRGNGLTVPLFAFNPNEPGVDKVELEGPDGEEILTTVHLASVVTREEGMAISTKVHTAALNRISFFHTVTIEDGKIDGATFSLVNPPPGNHLSLDAGEYLVLRDSLRGVVGLSAPNLKAELERASPPGEHRFGFFRSARHSMSPVEEFVHLYNILLMLCNDNQSDVDAFIRGEEPAVQQTEHPRKASGTMETVYTRLRNELAHPRTAGSLDATKVEVANNLGRLVSLTKRAIELLS
jgi:hypothetical protein